MKIKFTGGRMDGVKHVLNEEATRANPDEIFVEFPKHPKYPRCVYAWFGEMEENMRVYHYVERKTK